MDGRINAHRLVLGSISPFIKGILEESEHYDTNDPAELLLPDIQKEQMMFLLSIFYNGTLNMYKP